MKVVDPSELRKPLTYVYVAHYNYGHDRGGGYLNQCVEHPRLSYVARTRMAPRMVWQVDGEPVPQGGYADLADALAAALGAPVKITEEELAVFRLVQDHFVRYRDLVELISGEKSGAVIHCVHGSMYSKVCIALHRLGVKGMIEMGRDPAGASQKADDPAVGRLLWAPTIRRHKRWKDWTDDDANIGDPVSITLRRST